METVQVQVSHVFNETSRVIAEQKTPEEEMDNFLESVSFFRDLFKELFVPYSELLENMPTAISKINEDKKELIVLGIQLDALYDVSKKLYSSFHSKQDYRIGLITTLKNYDILIDDLHEYISDIKSIVDGNDAVDELFKKHSA